MAKEENISQKDLVKRLKAPKQTINYTIKDLINDGLVTVEDDKSDKRSKILNLSLKGEVFLSEMILPITNINDRVKMDMGDEKVDSLIKDLTKLSDSLEKNIQLENIIKKEDI